MKIGADLCVERLIETVKVTLSAKSAYAVQRRWAVSAQHVIIEVSLVNSFVFEHEVRNLHRIDTDRTVEK